MISSTIQVLRVKQKQKQLAVIFWGLFALSVVCVFELVLLFVNLNYIMSTESSVQFDNWLK